MLVKINLTKDIYADFLFNYIIAQKTCTFSKKRFQNSKTISQLGNLRHTCLLQQRGERMSAID